MKVIYKKSIIDKLVDAIEDAWLHEKEIEKIVLTKAEAYDFQKTWPLVTCPTIVGIFGGVPIEVEGK